MIFYRKQKNDRLPACFRLLLCLFLTWTAAVFPSARADAPRILILLEKGFNGDEFFGSSAADAATALQLLQHDSDL